MNCEDSKGSLESLLLKEYSDFPLSNQYFIIICFSIAKFRVISFRKKGLPVELVDFHFFYHRLRNSEFIW